MSAGGQHVIHDDDGFIFVLSSLPLSQNDFVMFLLCDVKEFLNSTYLMHNSVKSRKLL